MLRYPYLSTKKFMVIKLNNDNLGIEEAVKLLRLGELVAFPTETVYGLGAIANNEMAVAKIFATKNRPNFNPLISHYADINEIQMDVEFNPQALKLAEKFWPGPLTLVLNKKPNSRISKLASAGLNTAAVRIPSHPTALALLREIKLPIVAPSANPSTRVSPVSAEHVERLFSNKDIYILDGGRSQIGLESTVIDLSTETPCLLRYGGTALNTIEDLIGTITIANKNSEIKAPGMSLQHYAPTCPLRLDYINPKAGEALIAFGSGALPEGFTTVINISPSADLNEAASNLFAAIHNLESQSVSGIAVMPIPTEGLGIAINDRLQRAANKFN